MSATSFLRHRRATALAYIKEHVGRSKKRVAEVLERYNLNPDDLDNLAGNTDVLTIADEIAALELKQPELDDLETLDVLDVGPRAAVHSPDVRKDQFNIRLQHPAQETVGVGNMHDGPQSAEDIANVSKARVDEHDGSLADAAIEKANEDALANHGGLPPAAPTSAPAEQNQVTAEDEQQPTDPDGANPGAETIVDREQAAEDLQQQESSDEKLVKIGKAALAGFDREQLIDYAEGHQIALTNIGPRTAAKTILNQIIAAQGEE